MKKTARRLTLLAGVAVTLAGSTLAPAVFATADDGRPARPNPARTVHVTGEQIPIPGTPHFTMVGDLVGTWYYYPSTTLHDVPSLYSEAGTEVFVGCLDRNHDGVCPEGRDDDLMNTTFLAWASYKTDRKGNRTTLIKGQCVHPITGGQGMFKGSRGVLDMVDRLVDGDVKTTYTGEIVLNAVPSEPPAPPATPAASANRTVTATSAHTGC